MNFFPFSDNFLVFGIVVSDYASATPARQKMRRKVHSGPSVAEVRAVKKAFSSMKQSELDEVRARKDLIIKSYQESEEYKRELVEMLKPEMKRMLAQIHDYRQFVSQVVQNLNVILETRHPGLDIELQLREASREEVAIYWAARMMEEKIGTALFLLEPERIDDLRQRARFRFHGCVLKYLRIYQSAFERKGIQTHVDGESYGDVIANPAAIAVIPHTLLDNALKYAPPGSTVAIGFDESDAEITFSVASYGPRIDPDEVPKIFDLFYRGRRARVIEPDGTGFGLHLAQLIARKHGAGITVSQDGARTRAGLVWTEFVVSVTRG